MNTINSKVSLNNEHEINAGENETIKTASPEDRVMEDGKLTFWQFLCVARYFLPVLTTIGWIIGFTLGDIDFFIYFSLILIGIGLISAITVSPLKFIKFIFASTIKGFYILRGFIPVYGVADLVAALFGITFGFVFGVSVVFGLPAVFTIAKFFNKDSF